MTSKDSVVVLHRYTGTGKATGKKLNLLAAGVWDLHAGKIKRYRQLADTTEIVAVARALAAVQRHSRRGWRIDRATRRPQDAVDGIVALMMALERADSARAPARLVGWL